MATTTKRGASTKTKSTRSKSATASKKTTTSKLSKKTTSKRTSSAKASTSKKTSAVNVTKTEKVSTGKSSVFKQLKIWNLVLAVLAIGQAVALVVMSGKSQVSVTTNYLTEDKLSGFEVVARRHLLDFNILYLLVASLAVTAILHLLLATVLRKKYENQLKNGVNVARWVGLSLVSSLVMLTLAYVVGVTDLSTLVLIAATSASTALLAGACEARGATRKLSKVAGLLVGLGSWVVLAVFLLGSLKYGDGNLSNYVYYLLASSAVIVALFCINMHLGRKKVARWSDYTYTDRVYMLLNFLLVTSVSWQVFFSLLKK